MCDLAYAVLVEQSERDTLVERQVVAVLIGAGRIDQKDLPSVQDARERLDRALDAPLGLTTGEDPLAGVERLLGVVGG